MPIFRLHCFPVDHGLYAVTLVRYERPLQPTPLTSAWTAGSSVSGLNIKPGGDEVGERGDRRDNVPLAVTFSLTIVPNSDTHQKSRSPKGRQPATPADGARAVPAGGGSSPPLPGGSGELRPAGMMTGLRGNPLDWDRKERVTPASDA